MSRHDVIHAPLQDTFGIGQAKVARIQLEIAEQGMAETYLAAFQLGYVNPLWRAAHRRLFAKYRGQYEQAKSILEVMQ